MNTAIDQKLIFNEWDILLNPIPIFGYDEEFKYEEKIREGYKIADERAELLVELRNDVGDELFNSLTQKEKEFIIETEGAIDFGYQLNEEDLKRISRSLEEDYEY